MQGHKAKAEQLLSELSPLKLEIYNTANLLLCRAHWICNRFLDRMNVCLELMSWAMEVGSKAMWFWSDLDAFRTIEAAYFYKAIYVSRNLDFDGALGLLGHFRDQCHLAKRFFLPELIERERLLTTRRLLTSADPKAIKRGLRTLLKEIGEPIEVSDRLYSLYIRVIEYCFQIRDVALARPWLKLLAEANLDTRRVGKAVSGFMVELTFWYTVGELTEVENCVRRLLYFVETRNVEQDFARAIAAGFRQMAKNDVARNTAIDAFLKTLHKFAENDDLLIYFEIFDLRNYLHEMRTK